MTTPKTSKKKSTRKKTAAKADPAPESAEDTTEEPEEVEAEEVDEAVSAAVQAGVKSALAELTPDGGGPAVPMNRELTRDQIDLIKRTVAVGATDDELALFLHQCKIRGMDPLGGQMYAIKRWDQSQRREVMAYQMGYAGLLLIAQRTGEMDGFSGMQWCDHQGRWFDEWTSDASPQAAKVTVHRKGHSHGYKAVARFAAYAATKKDGSLNHFWAKMGDLMLMKCAKALALREAFPQELGGVYASEEMQQAENAPQGPPAPAPARTPRPQAETPRRAQQAPPPAQPASGDPVEAKAAESGVRRMNSKYRFHCRICGEDGVAGDEIAYLRQNGESKVAHWSCFAQEFQAYSEAKEEPEEERPTEAAAPEQPKREAPERAAAPEDDDLPF